MGILDEYESRRHESARHRENSARLAQAYAKFETSGQGTLEFDERVDFGLTFIEEPYMAYGSFCDTDALNELQGLEPGESPLLPNCTGYVTDWDLDERDFYVGCWIGVRVNFSPLDLMDPQMLINIKHFFTFSAIGIKDIPPLLTD